MSTYHEALTICRAAIHPAMEELSIFADEHDSRGLRTLDHSRSDQQRSVKYLQNLKRPPWR